ncbi:dihydroorotase [Helicobacter mehlei]|uniref:Dihydroorotase n=1 Tax=Helicobacter mehlei TaxID=2316080 RepID=A0A553USP3_9HELI|nr:dihydroorotase [Helicobacter mehlei]TSA83226.1 dihydroorotase [Helicobacter mehlei]
MDTLTLHNPLDMHLHLREGDLLQAILPFSARYFSAAVVMPNLAIPITNTALALEYKARIEQAGFYFAPLIALYLTPDLTRRELEKAREAGFFLLKLYPHNATTNSTHGVQNILSPQMLRILSVAQDLGFILCVHAESLGFVMQREVEFHPILNALVAYLPYLTIIIEHLSDRRSIPLLEQYENLYATLTLHHIALSLDDVLGNHLNPHLFCKPLLKTPQDQQALLELALSAHPKVAFGSDSAPHLIGNKHTCACSAGIFSAPILLEALTTLFDRHHALDKLPAFISHNAQRIYHLDPHKLPAKRITLAKKPHTPPKSCYNDQLQIPFFFDLAWSVIDP